MEGFPQGSILGGLEGFLSVKSASHFVAPTLQGFSDSRIRV